MKPGCFIKFVIVLTIVVAVVVWIIQNKLDDFVLNPARKAFVELLMNGVDKKIAILKESSEKDSLRLIIKDFVENKVKSMNTFNTEMFDPLKDSLNNFSGDSILNKHELAKLIALFHELELKGSAKK